MRKVSTVTGIAEGRVAILVTVDVFRLLDGVRNSKMLTVTGIAEGRLAIRVTVFRLSDDVLKSNVDSYRDGGRQGRHPRNCRRFSTVGQCSEVKNVDSYRDRSRQGRHPRNCRRFSTLGCCSKLKKCRQLEGSRKAGSPSS